MGSCVAGIAFANGLYANTSHLLGYCTTSSNVQGPAPFSVRAVPVEGAEVPPVPPSYLHGPPAPPQWSWGFPGQWCPSVPKGTLWPQEPMKVPVAAGSGFGPAVTVPSLVMPPPTQGGFPNGLLPFFGQSVPKPHQGAPLPPLSPGGGGGDDHDKMGMKKEATFLLPRKVVLAVGLRVHPVRPLRIGVDLQVVVVGVTILTTTPTLPCLGFSTTKRRPLCLLFLRRKRMVPKVKLRNHSSLHRCRRLRSIVSGRSHCVKPCKQVLPRNRRN